MNHQDCVNSPLFLRVHSNGCRLAAIALFLTDDELIALRTDRYVCDVRVHHLLESKDIFLCLLIRFFLGLFTSFLLCPGT